MLAYVFWHWPLPGTSASAYEDALLAFHRALAHSVPEGLLGSAAVRVRPMPFTPVGPGGAAGGPTGGTAYEDWYLLESSAALDPLDQAAVRGACAEPHAGVSAMAGGGTAGLYRLVAGTPDVGRAVAASWRDLPDRTARDAAVAELAATADTVDGSLWMRRMTLGPAPELCLLGDATLDGVAGAAGAVAQRRALVRDATS